MAGFGGQILPPHTGGRVRSGARGGGGLRVTQQAVLEKLKDPPRRLARPQRAAEVTLRPRRHRGWMVPGSDSLTSRKPLLAIEISSGLCIDERQDLTAEFLPGQPVAFRLDQDCQGERVSAAMTRIVVSGPASALGAGTKTFWRASSRACAIRPSPHRDRRVLLPHRRGGAGARCGGADPPGGDRGRSMAPTGSEAAVMPTSRARPRGRSAHRGSGRRGMLEERHGIGGGPNGEVAADQVRAYSPAATLMQSPSLAWAPRRPSSWPVPPARPRSPWAPI
jgi:hypothetical protein